MDDSQSAGSPNPFRFAEVSKPLKESHLQLDQIISIAADQESAQMAAIIKNITPDQLSLEVPKPLPNNPFQRGNRVRLKIWDYDEAFYCDSEVVEGSGGNLVVKRPTEGKSLQRKKAYQVHSKLLFSFSVVEAAEDQLANEKGSDIEAVNLTAGGLEFHSPLPFQKGDKSRVTVHLPPSQEIHALGSVARVAAVESEDDSLHSITLKFEEISAEEQNQLLLFLALSSPEDAIFDVHWVG